MALFNDGANPAGGEKQPKKISKTLLLLFVFILVFAAVFFTVQWYFGGHSEDIFSGNLEVSAIGAVPVIPASVAAGMQVKNIPVAQAPVVDNTKINAQAAFSVKLAPTGDEILFQQFAQKKMPIASLTKLMTALVVFQHYQLDQQVVISKNAMAQEGDQGNVKLGEVLSVKNLLYISLIESSNRSAYALSEVMGTEAFIALMNQQAAELGLANTHFDDSTGLSSASYSTAQDIATLSEYLFENYPLFREIISLKEFNLYLPDGTLHHKLISTNQLLGELGIMGGKTGWTNEARGCFMAIQHNDATGSYMIHVILGAEDRFLEMKKLINFAGV